MTGRGCCMPRSAVPGMSCRWQVACRTSPNVAQVALVVNYDLPIVAKECAHFHSASAALALTTRHWPGKARHWH